MSDEQETHAKRKTLSELKVALKEIQRIAFEAEADGDSFRNHQRAINTNSIATRASCYVGDLELMLLNSNIATMREALAEIVLLNLKVGKSIRADVACGIMASKAHAALYSAPPRNCDVGTAEEQAVRFADYCFANQDGVVCDDDCPQRHTIAGCELAWAQMPYEESEVEG